MAKPEYPDYICLRRLALKAGKIIVRNFGDGSRSAKEDGTPITLTDKIINQLVVEAISCDFPDVEVKGEEGCNNVDGAKYRVIFDPLDGTFPFLFGLPISSFCISVIETERGIPLVAVIYDPFCKRMWHAVRGEGAFLNGKPIRVSQRNCINGSVIGMIWWKNSPYHLNRVCDKLTGVGATCFNPLSIAILGGLIASGKMEATIFPGRNVWETPAMQLIVEEAGGKTTDIHGKEIRYGPDNTIQGHIVSNGLIHNELVAIVASCQQ